MFLTSWLLTMLEVTILSEEHFTIYSLFFLNIEKYLVVSLRISDIGYR